MFKTLYGSALFQRGQLLALCMVTFDSLEFTVKFDFIAIDINRLRGTSFLLHHEVPTYTN